MTEEITKVMTPPFRVSFPNVFEKSQYKGSEPKYGITMIFDVAGFNPTEKKQFTAMKGLLEAACQEKFGKSLKICAKNTNFKRSLRDGSEKEDLDGYGEGKVFAAATSKRQPGLIDRDKQAIISEQEFYPGCYARATVTAYGYDNVSKGVAFGLHNIQKLGEGEDFSGRVSADEDFGDDAADVWGDEEVAPDSEGDDGLLD